jgi:hypothetical protein
MTQERPSGLSAAPRSLAESAALVWPAPAHVAVVDTVPDSADDEATTAYALLPDAVDPRLAVPLRPLAAAAAVARSQTAAASTRAAVRNSLVALAFRTGVAGLLVRGRLVVTQARGAADGLDDLLADLLGEPVCLGIRVGPPRANRKPVLQVVSRRGRLLAYAKVGTTRLTDRLVRAESQTLTALAEADLGEVRVPQVLHVGAWHGHPLLVQAPLPVRRAGVPGRERLTAAMVAVARTGAAPDTELTRTPWWERTSADVDALPAGGVAVRLRAVQEDLRHLAAGVQVPVAAWHGDWNAGNCSVVPDAVLVWDWERYETGVPAGFDALHLALQTGLGATQRGPDADRGAVAERVLAQASALTAPFGVAADAAGLVAAAYLWGLGVRYATDDQDAAGASVGRLGDWLLPVLESWCGQTGRDRRAAAGEPKQPPGQAPRQALKVEGH